MEVDHYEHQSRAAQTRSGRKRATPPVVYDDEEEEEDFVDQLAPTAMALKKRRLVEQTARRRRGETTPPVQSVEDNPEPEGEPPKRVKKEVDVLEVARNKREQAEELARKEREALQEALSGMDIEAIRNLAIIEEIEITRQPPPQRASRADESDRWDDQWNGRKNFKRFRRRGEAGSRANFHRVIVPLEEVKKKDFGIGDDYWLEDDNQRRNKKDEGQEAQDTFPSQSLPRRKTGASTRAAEVVADGPDDEPQERDAGGLLSSDLEILEEPPEPAPAPRSRRSQDVGASSVRSQTKPAAANNKRPAPTSFAKAAPAKKARQTAARRKDDSDDSDDELKFRFRK